MRVAGLAIGFVLTLACGQAGKASASEPASLTCTFTSGRAHTYEKGRFKPAKASALRIAISNIDADKQSASLKSGMAATTLRVVRAVNALHFIEVVGEGYLNITTVYDAQAAGKPMPAAHSRHFGVLGQPVISHYMGTCAAS
jgi:hypothetical protein